DDSTDPFTNPETIASGDDPDPPGDGPNVVDVEISDTVSCEFVTPPPSQDTATLDAAPPDIDMTVSPDRDLVADGDTVTYTFTLTNAGDGDSLAAPVEFRLDTLDAGWTGVSVEVTGSPGAPGAC